MAPDRDEWVRLPGLFRWEEVSEVFALAAGFDDEWRFDVRAVPSEDGETLYIVHAAPAEEERSDREVLVSGIIPIPGARERISRAS